MLNINWDAAVWALTITSLTLLTTCRVDHHNQSVAVIPLTVPAATPAAPAPTLRDFTSQMLDKSPTKLSPARKAILADQISRIAEATFKTREHQEAFVLLIRIESGYNTQARSKMGAVGLTQVLPKYASSFAKECGLGAVEAEDLMDAETNLRVGACQFNHLLVVWKNNIALALSAYNSGEQSPTTKGFAKGKEGNAETANYISKFYVLREENK